MSKLGEVIRYTTYVPVVFIEPQTSSASDGPAPPTGVEVPSSLVADDQTSSSGPLDDETPVADKQTDLVKASEGVLRKPSALSYEWHTLLCMVRSLLAASDKTTNFTSLK